ncbi:MAG TPA: signal peptidase II [Bacilli bacterium]|nr:signal peptidase II [Bacilli bacterium]
MKSKITAFLKKAFHSYVWLAGLLIVIDQITKYFALTNKWNITVIPNFFSLNYVRNTGAAWSILSGNMTLLAVISFIAGAAIIFYRIYKRKEFNTYLKIMFALLLAGTWGNFIDRAFYKLLTGEAGVVDFFEFYLGPWLGYFPTFNVADAAITVSLFGFIAFLIYDEIRMKKLAKEETNGDED